MAFIYGVIASNWNLSLGYTGILNFGHLAFEVDDIYAVCEKLSAGGVTILRPPRDGRMAFVRSPDQISVELLQKGEAQPVKEPWARDVAASTVGEALKGADFFLGLSVPGVCTAEDLKTMADKPIIFLTAHDDSEGVVLGFEAGGADYVTKPFRKDGLLARGVQLRGARSAETHAGNRQCPAVDRK